MLLQQRKSALARVAWANRFALAAKVTLPARLPSMSSASETGGAAPSQQLTGSAKLFADALEEERVEASSDTSPSPRDHLVQTQGPIWTGDESTHDAVLRMLIDAHPPLRTGDKVSHTTADRKIKGWMKDLNLKYEPGVPLTPPPSTSPATSASAHRTAIPPHLHRPWHATYTGDNQVIDEPSIKYGSFIRKRVDGDALTNLLELELPPDVDGKTRNRVRAARRSNRVTARYDRAREGAIDYRLGIGEGDVTDIGVEDDDAFKGNRQLRGASVLGAQRGGASGMRAWAGLVEERIQSAKDKGIFKHIAGRGAPIVRDPEANNPHLELGEMIMNRIVKRQGALPPWIELQNNLDSTLNAFRSTMLSTYTTHLVRTVISTNALNPLPPLHSIPSHDEVWEARERKFHEENIKQINDLVRKMNAQAPFIARRPLVTLEPELSKIRGDVLKNEVWQEIQRRAKENAEREALPTRRSFLSALEGSRTVQKLERGALRSFQSFGKSSIGMSGGGAASASHGDAGGGVGLLIFSGVGIGLLLYMRRPTHAESPETDLIPVHSTPRFVASSPAEPRYHPLEFIQVYVIEPFLTFLRFIHLAILFVPVIVSTPMMFVGAPPRKRKLGKPVHDDEDNWGAVWWYGFLVAQMERAGPSFIKLGQWAASRTDLFPAALCDKMSKLHSNGDPHPLRHTKRVIENAFGLKFDEIFEEFGETPIGCGAIAQVYKATLRPELIAAGTTQDTKDLGHDERLSTSVAIKVLHPRARKIVRRDIAIMSVFANIVNAFPGMEWISLPEEVAVFGEMMNSQLDLRVEASNLDHFEANFDRRGRNITFPRPIRLGHDDSEIDARRDVLIEEFEDALPLKYFLRNGGGPYDEQIANIGLDAFLEMLLLDNWTHGDLHPGNIMVRFIKPTTRDYFAPLLNKFHHRAPTTAADVAAADSSIPTESVSATDLVHSLASIASDKDAWLTRLDQLNTEGYVPQLIFIDAGLVTSLDDKNRRNFLDLFQAVAEFDGYKAGKLMVERCRRPDLAIDEETFALKMQHLILSIKSKTFSLAKIKISDILSDVLTAVRQHHVKLEGDFVNTVISILLLEGIGRQLDPDMDLFKSALPILRQLGRQMGTREAIAAVPRGNIWAMVKLWVWAEAREVAGEATAIDDWIKYDRLMPAI